MRGDATWQSSWHLAPKALSLSCFGVELLNSQGGGTPRLPAHYVDQPHALLEPNVIAHSTFKIIKHNPFVIRVGGDIDREFHFTLPQGTVMSANSLLDFSVECHLDDGEDAALLWTDLNGKVTADGFGDGETAFVRHIYKGGLLKEGTSANTLQFTIETVLGRGKLRILEVVLWVKVAEQ